jgi:hypothetical protein
MSQKRTFSDACHHFRFRRVDGKRRHRGAYVATEGQGPQEAQRSLAVVAAAASDFVALGLRGGCRKNPWRPPESPSRSPLTIGATATLSTGRSSPQRPGSLRCGRMNTGRGPSRRDPFPDSHRDERASCSDSTGARIGRPPGVSRARSPSRRHRPRPRPERARRRWATRHSLGCTEEKPELSRHRT